MEQPCWISKEFNAEFKTSIPNANIVHYSVYMNTTFLKGQKYIIENQSVFVRINPDWELEQSAFG